MCLVLLFGSIYQQLLWIYQFLLLKITLSIPFTAMGKISREDQIVIKA